MIKAELCLFEVFFLYSLREAIQQLLFKGMLIIYGFGVSAQVVCPWMLIVWHNSLSVSPDKLNNHICKEATDLGLNFNIQWSLYINYNFINHPLCIQTKAFYIIMSAVSTAHVHSDFRFWYTEKKEAELAKCIHSSGERSLTMREVFA